MDFTMKDVEQEVRRLVRENPDFIYGQQDLESVDQTGTCSYLAGVTEQDFAYAKKVGFLQDNISFEEAIESGTVGKPCIVGQALQNLGVSREWLSDFEGNSAQFVVGSLGLEPGGVNGIAFSLWLDAVQGGQDSNLTWKTSLVDADEEYGVELNRA